MAAAPPAPQYTHRTQFDPIVAAYAHFIPGLRDIINLGHPPPRNHIMDNDVVSITTTQSSLHEEAIRLYFGQLRTLGFPDAQGVNIWVGNTYIELICQWANSFTHADNSPPPHNYLASTTVSGFGQLYNFVRGTHKPAGHEALRNSLTASGYGPDELMDVQFWFLPIHYRHPDPPHNGHIMLAVVSFVDRTIEFLDSDWDPNTPSQRTLDAMQAIFREIVRFLNTFLGPRFCHDEWRIRYNGAPRQIAGFCLVHACTNAYNTASGFSTARTQRYLQRAKGRRMIYEILANTIGDRTWPVAPPDQDNHGLYKPAHEPPQAAYRYTKPDLPFPEWLVRSLPPAARARRALYTNMEVEQMKEHCKTWNKADTAAGRPQKYRGYTRWAVGKGMKVGERRRRLRQCLRDRDLDHSRGMPINQCRPFNVPAYCGNPRRPR